MLKTVGIAMVASLLPPGEEMGPGFLLRAIGQVGVSAVIALGLTYFLVVKMGGSLESSQAEHRDMLIFLRAICINVAADDRSRANCPPLLPDYRSDRGR